MELGDVERFEIVVWRFDFGAFDDGEADGEEDIFDLLKDLANEMVRAEWTDDSRQGEVDALASACGFVGAGFDGFAALFDFRFDVGAELIELLADDALEVLARRVAPGVPGLAQGARIAGQPGHPE